MFIHVDTNFMFEQEQQNTIKTFVEERDSLLSELSLLRVEKESLSKDVNSLSESKSEIIESIQYHRGQLSIMEDFEEERSVLISRELSELIKTKTENQLIIASQTREVSDLETKRKDLELSIVNLMPVLERVTWQINQLTITVDKVVTSNTESATEVNQLLSELRQVLLANK